MTAATPDEDNPILPPLALALVDHPRATLQELAKAVGISKATLYRFCRTREELLERLARHSLAAMDEALLLARLDEGTPLEALRRLIAHHLEHREFTTFLAYYWKDLAVSLEEQADWEATVDAFFLRGQQQGVFRIDFSAAALTELWVSITSGLIDAERRGRVARAGLAQTVEQALVHGVLRPDA